MRLVVLGSGGGVPSPARNPSTLGIRHEGAVYLLDCAEGTQRQMMVSKLSYMKVAAVFLSHDHADHILGLPGLLETMEMQGREEDIDIIGPKGTADLLQHLLHHAAAQFPIHIHETKPGFHYKVPGLTVTTFPTDHHHARSQGYVLQTDSTKNFDKAKCAALGIRGSQFSQLQSAGMIQIGKKKIRIEDVTVERPGLRIVYTGDTRPTDSTVKAAKGADLLIHDSTFSSDLKDEAGKRGHSTAAEAAAIAKQARVRKLLLTHISARYQDDPAPLLAEARKVFKNSELAHDGLEIQITRPSTEQE